MPNAPDPAVDPSACCSAVAIPVGDALYALRFELRNVGETAIELPAEYPFTAFSVTATAGGQPLVVHQPALDIAVRPTTFHLPAGGRITVETPIRLRIAEGAEAGTDGFIWTIAHRREALSLQVLLDLPGAFGGPCPVSLQ